MKQLWIVFTILFCISLSSCGSGNMIRESLTAQNSCLKMQVVKMEEGPHSFTYMTGPHSSRTHYSKDPTVGLFWITLNVTNIGNEVYDFDFQRIRIITERFITTPMFTSGTGFFSMVGPDEFYVKIKPKEKIVRSLIFPYFKGIRPYRIVYDSITNNKIENIMTFDIPEKSK